VPLGHHELKVSHVVVGQDGLDRRFRIPDFKKIGTRRW